MGEVNIPDSRWCHFDRNQSDDKQWWQERDEAGNLYFKEALPGQTECGLVNSDLNFPVTTSQIFDVYQRDINSASTNIDFVDLNLSDSRIQSDLTRYINKTNRIAKNEKQAYIDRLNRDGIERTEIIQIAYEVAGDVVGFRLHFYQNGSDSPFSAVDLVPDSFKQYIPGALDVSQQELKNSINQEAQSE